MVWPPFNRMRGPPSRWNRSGRHCFTTQTTSCGETDTIPLPTLCPRCTLWLVSAAKATTRPVARCYHIRHARTRHGNTRPTGPRTLADSRCRFLGRCPHHRHQQLRRRPVRSAAGGGVRMAAHRHKRVAVGDGHQQRDGPVDRPHDGPPRGPSGHDRKSGALRLVVCPAPVDDRAVAPLRAEPPSVRGVLRSRPPASRQTRGHLVPQKSRHGDGRDDDGKQLRWTRRAAGRRSCAGDRLMAGGVRYHSRVLVRLDRLSPGAGPTRTRRRAYSMETRPATEMHPRPG